MNSVVNRLGDFSNLSGTHRYGARGNQRVTSNIEYSTNLCLVRETAVSRIQDSRKQR